MPFLQDINPMWLKFLSKLNLIFLVNSKMALEGVQQKLCCPNIALWNISYFFSSWMWFLYFLFLDRLISSASEREKSFSATTCNLLNWPPNEILAPIKQIQDSGVLIQLSFSLKFLTLQQRVTLESDMKERTHVPWTCQILLFPCSGNKHSMWSHFFFSRNSFPTHFGRHTLYI